jgi:hypothetical protein
MRAPEPSASSTRAVLVLGRPAPNSRRFLRSLGDQAEEWPGLGLASIPAGVPIPTSVSDELAASPRKAGTDRLSMLNGLDRVLRQGRSHRTTLAPNGNGELAAAAGGSVDPLPYPRVDPETGAIHPDFGTRVRTRLGWMAAVNLSLGMGPGEPFDSDDPINHATRSVSIECPVVMAAGNARGFRRGPAALSSWARAPWVISVAGLREGRLADDSAFGRESDPASWPDLAAPDDRMTVYDVSADKLEAPRGTSFAASVVSLQLSRIAAFCLTLRTALMGHSEQREGVPRVGVGVVDRSIDPSRLATPPWPYGMLPEAAVDPESAATLRRHCETASWVLDASPSTRLLTALLRASARPVEDHGPHQIGAGEVSDGATAQFLASLTAERFLRIGWSRDPEAVRISNGLKGVQLTDDGLAGAMEIWDASNFAWAYDLRRPGIVLNLTFIRQASGR